MSRSFHELLVAPYIRQAEFAARPPWSYGDRKLLDYLLIYVEEGRCRFTVNGTDYDFREGDFCLVQPGDQVYHEGLTHTLTPFAHLDFFYNLLREKSFPTSAGMINIDPYVHLLQPRLNDFPEIDIPVRFRPSQTVLFRSKMMRMIGCWIERNVHWQIEVQQLGTELLLELIRDFGRFKSETKTPSVRLDRIASYVSLHLHENVTVKDMARQAHLSPSRFHAVFRDKYGVSPYQFLLRLRIERAIDMLRNEPDYTISQVAQFCGFNNIQHFSKTFKAITGEPPSRMIKKGKSVKTDEAEKSPASAQGQKQFA